MMPRPHWALFDGFGVETKKERGAHVAGVGGHQRKLLFERPNAGVWGATGERSLVVRLLKGGRSKSNAQCCDVC